MSKIDHAVQRDMPSLAIVVPCYDEQESLPNTIQALRSCIKELVDSGFVSSASRIYLVDDGSADQTWALIQTYAETEEGLVGVKLSRNRGHQRALYAGLRQTTEDLVVSIDADLQDGPENIAKMVAKNREGFDIVYGVRARRDADTFFKRTTAEGYYRVMKLLGVNLVFNHADFRLMSRRALDALLSYSEANLFLRGMVVEVGFPSAEVTYDRQARYAGESKYPLRKMLALAWVGVTSFSAAPLRAITLLGVASSIIALAFIVWVLAIKVFTDQAVPGWASTLVPLLFIGSVQLLSLGVIGEYLAKVYEEVKRRPKYHVDKIVGRDRTQ